MEPYPATSAARDRFVVDRRGPRPHHDPWRDQGLIVEDERTERGETARVATVFLTGRECPWRCAMCDLWRYTTASDTPLGAIPAQVAAARSALAHETPVVTQMKLYNAGNFFDPRAVPEHDYDSIACSLTGIKRIIVESHPALIGARVDQWLACLDNHRAADGSRSTLEVAMGLETIHAAALARLNKQMTIEQFARGAQRLRARDVAVRVFLLIAPPFVPGDEQDTWLLASVDAAFSFDATVVSLVPTRPGNGALDALAASGFFRQPTLADIERSADLALARGRGRGRVFVDLWDLERFSSCRRCFASRRARLHTMNLEQRVLPSVSCSTCNVDQPPAAS